MPSTLVLVDGETYRVGQVGAFVRVPLGYTQLYGICTQVGSSAVPQSSDEQPPGFRWLSMSLFGEAVGNVFERGVSQYPTVGDEVHLVTRDNLRIIYESESEEGTITIGDVAAASGIPARLRISSLVSRHFAIVGSTGAGKSNLVTVLHEAIATQGFPTARTLIIDPHGEYAQAMKDYAHVFKINADATQGESELSVPYWALPFDELRDVGLGGMQPNHEMAVREAILKLKREAAAKLPTPPPFEAITADTPIPFSIKRLWFELDDFERQTFSATGNGQNAETLNDLITPGDAETMTPNVYPAASNYNTAPHKNATKRNIERQLELLRSRVVDARFQFLFDPAYGLAPSLDGDIEHDL
ncbi:MAG: ATP-binding protein, partial [Planctomycetota bacterium]